MIHYGSMFINSLLSGKDKSELQRSFRSLKITLHVQSPARKIGGMILPQEVTDVFLEDWSNSTLKGGWHPRGGRDSET